MADASNKQEEPQISKPKKEKVEEEKKPVEVKKFNYEDMKPIYSEEELAEIEEQEYEDENAWDEMLTMKNMTNIMMTRSWFHA